MNKKFVDLVKKMREAQRNYFETRSVDYLKEAFRLEKEIDKLLIEINRQGNRLDLFDDKN